MPGERGWVSECGLRLVIEWSVDTPFWALLPFRMSSDSLASRIQALQVQLATSLDGQLTALGDALAQVDQTSDRLEPVSAELAELVALRMGQLATLLAQGEQRARRLIATELEIERQRADTARTTACIHTALPMIVRMPPSLHKIAKN